MEKSVIIVNMGKIHTQAHTKNCHVISIFASTFFSLKNKMKILCSFQVSKSFQKFTIRRQPNNVLARKSFKPFYNASISIE